MPTIYATDPQTAEAEIFMEEADFPTDHMMLSQDENYIASFCSNSNSSNDKLILVDLNEKGNFSEYDIFVPQSGGFCFMSADENQIVMQSWFGDYFLVINL